MPLTLRLLAPVPVLDQGGDGHQRQAVTGGEFTQLGLARHRAVLVEDLADDRRGPQASQGGEVDRRLRVPGALQHAAGTGAERENVAGLDKFVRPGVRMGQQGDRARAVEGADARRDPLGRVDRHREGGAHGLAVLLHHGIDPQPL